MGYASPFIRVYANESRGSVAGAKSHYRDCGAPITWFVTVLNGKKVPVDGHDPVPHRTERDEDGKTIEIHDRETLHFATCTKREGSAARPHTDDALPSDRARERDHHRWRNES